MPLKEEFPWPSLSQVGQTVLRRLTQSLVLLQRHHLLVLAQEQIHVAVLLSDPCRQNSVVWSKLRVADACPKSRSYPDIAGDYAGPPISVVDFALA